MAVSLVERLAELTDPRDRRGRQYPMVGLLTRCVPATLAGAARAMAARPELAPATRHDPDSTSDTESG